MLPTLNVTVSFSIDAVEQAAEDGGWADNEQKIGLAFFRPPAYNSEVRIPPAAFLSS